MLNWNIIPMTYNDSFTYMEWLGKLNYVAELHEERLDQQEKEIVDLWAKVNDHEERIGTLEDWRTNTVDPFIDDMTVRVGVIEDWKEDTVDPFIANITDWKDDVVDPFITDITDWKTDTVTPFIQETNQAISDINDDIDNLESDLAAERASRETSTGALNERVDAVQRTAQGALDGVTNINEKLNNMGGIRYFMVDLVNEATITTSGSDKIVVFPLPDDDFTIIDVRGHYGTTEFRVTTNILGTEVTTDTYKAKVQDQTAPATGIEVKLTLVGGASDTLDRLDYVLYNAALKPGEQNQADIDFYNRMDTNGDGVINAVDASWTLSYYAWSATDAKRDPVAKDLRGQELWAFYANKINTEKGTTMLNPQAFPDYTGDNIANAVDASYLLSYYAFVSTTHNSGLTGSEMLRAFRNRNQ